VLFDGIDLSAPLAGLIIEGALKDKSKQGHFSATQAADFVATWKIVSHQKNTDSGFSATLFKNKNTGEYVYSLRGTEPSQKIDDILITDVGDIVTDGLAIKQIVDMYNDWQRINAGEGEVYKVVQFDLLATETALLQAERLIIPGFVAGPYELSLRGRSDIIIDGPLGLVYTIERNLNSNEVFSDERAYGAEAIPAGTNVTTVGHSMGGHLAVAFSRLFPDATTDAVTINGAGFMTGLIGGLSGNAEVNIRNLFDMLGGSDAFSSSRILNLYGEKGWEATTMDSIVGLDQQGGHQGIFIEDTWNNTLGHGKEQMTDALAVYDLFIRLDPQFQTGAGVFDKLNPIFEAVTGEKDRMETYEKLINIFGQLFVTEYVPIAKAQWQSDRESLYNSIKDIREAIQDKSLTITPLGTTDSDGKFTALSASAIETLARNDIAYRYALVNLNPFAVLGADYTKFNSNGQLDLYDPATGAGQLSEEYLADRAMMLNNLIYANVKDVTYTGTGVHFVDLATGIKINEGAAAKKLIFGSEIGEILEGFKPLNGSDDVGDHLYGGGGNDKLYGYRGDDYLEGGEGNDNIDCGAGNDINDPWIKENLLTVFYQDSGSLNSDILSNLLTGFSEFIAGNDHLVGVLLVFGDNVGLLDGHGMPELNEAIKRYNEILTKFTEETTFSDLSTVYLLGGKDDFNSANQVFDAFRIENMPDRSPSLETLGYTNTTGELAPLSSYAISNHARDNIAYRYALVNLNPFGVLAEQVAA
jgi:hypothetical protein